MAINEAHDKHAFSITAKVNLEYYARRGLISEIEHHKNIFYSTDSRDGKDSSYQGCCDLVEDAMKMFEPDDRIIKKLEEDLKLMRDKMENGK